MKHVEAAARDFTGIFDRLALPYAIMSGLAVRAFGVPRPTYDVDITLLVKDAQRPALLDAVEEAGYSVPDVYRSGWVDRVGQMPLIKFRLYRDAPGEGVDVDLFLAETAYQRRLLQRRVAADVEGSGRVLDRVCGGSHSLEARRRPPPRQSRYR